MGSVKETGAMTNPPSECLIKCLYEQSGMYKEGAFAFDTMMDIAKQIGPDIAGALQNCIDTMAGANDCEKASSLMACKVKAHQDM